MTIPNDGTAPEHFIIDQVQAICDGCKEVRTVPIDPPMQSAAELIDFLKTKLFACKCGAATCNIKARFAKDKYEPGKN